MILLLSLLSVDVQVVRGMHCTVGSSASVARSFKGLSGYVTSRSKPYSGSAMSLSLRFISAGTLRQYQDFSASVKGSNTVNLPQMSVDAKSYKVAVS